MGYQVKTVDTAAVMQAAAPLTPGALSVNSFHVLSIPAGATLSVGDANGQLIPVFPGFYATFCPPVLNGLIYQVTGAAAGLAVVLVWTGDGQSGGPQ